LKQSLGLDPLVQDTAVTKYIDLVKKSGVVIPDNQELTMFLYWDDAVDYIPISSITPELVLYLTIPGQYNWVDLPKDSLITTIDSPYGIRINVYDSGNWINGFGKLVKPDLKFNKCTVHIIDAPFLLAPPCKPSDLTCISNDNWIDTTIAEDLKTLSDYSIFVGYLQNSGITFPSPYTLFLIPDTVWTFGVNGPALFNYFNKNQTAADEYIQKFYCAGTLFPNVAAKDVTNVQSADGTVYNFTALSTGLSVLINDDGINGGYQGDAHVRNDGIYYLVSVTDPVDLFPFDVPATPVEPSPVPTKPQGPIPQPEKYAPSAGIQLNGMQLWVYLFFVLAILFLM
jgi:hypothetical protein